MCVVHNLVTTPSCLLLSVVYGFRKNASLIVEMLGISTCSEVSLVQAILVPRLEMRLPLLLQRTLMTLDVTVNGFRYQLSF